MVKVTMTFSSKKLIIWQCLRLEPLNLMAEVKVTVTFSAKQAYNSAILGARSLKHRGMFLMTRR